MKNQIGNYIQHIIYLTPSQIESFGKSFIIPQNYSNLKNKKCFIVFLTKTQIKKMAKAKANKEKVDLKFSKTQFKKTLNHVSIENRKNLQLLLKNIKEENRKKLDKINKTEENKKNRPKPKKKRLRDVIKFPEINLI